MPAQGHPSCPGAVERGAWGGRRTERLQLGMQVAHWLGGKQEQRGGVFFFFCQS